MVQLTSMVDYENVGGVAVLTLNNPPVNALSQGVRQGLKEGVAKALADESAKAILIARAAPLLPGRISLNLPAGPPSRVCMLFWSQWKTPVSRLLQPSMALPWAVDWRLRCVVTIVWQLPVRSLACPRLTWACCREPEAPSACREWWG